MRKSTIAGLFLLQLAALFIFENIYSLLREIEKKSIAEMTHQAEEWADLGIREYGRDKRSIQRLPFFDAALVAAQQEEAGNEIVREGADRFLIIRRPLGEGETLILRKRIPPTTVSIGTLKRILLFLLIIMAFFLLLTAVYFLYRLKKERGEEAADGLPPIQKYLLELKNAQQELQKFVDEQSQRSQQKEELSRNIISNLHLAVILLNPADQIEIFNPAAEAIFSRSFSLAKNSDPADVFSGHPELLRHIAANNEKKSGEIESGHKTFFVDLIPIPQLGKLILLRDITEEKVRDRIQRINSSLLILGEMTASLAHEVKNSLGVMFGYARMLQGDGEKSARMIDEIQSLTRLMETFLSFAKPVEELNWQRCDLKEMLRQLAGANDIELRLPAGKMIMNGDPILLNRIFSNLLLNSRQAGATKVAIDFSSGEVIDIRFSDNGGGIDAKNREKIWLPFFSTKEKGTGMGLPIVKKTVNAMNGDIQLLSSDASGTAFLLSFYPG